MTVQKQSKLPRGCIAAPSLILVLCAACFGISMFADVSTPAPSASPTLDTTTLAAQVAETSLAARLATMSVPSATAESTTTAISFATETETLVPVFIPATGASCIPNNPLQTGKVVQVVDGDTIKVILDEDGLTYSIRYIGMDTPENTSQVEYFGAEATAKNTELVHGKAVALIKDVSETDQFGRLLRYVIVGAVFVNYELVAQGYANTASYPPDIACISTFQEVEQKASASKLGLWAVPPTLVVVPTANSSSGGSGGNAPCNCGGPDLNCDDFSSHSSTQACYNFCSSTHGDVFGLDGSDNDGLACENLP